jgi:hypothetical protein
MRSIFQYRHPPTPKAELKHVYIVELWRHYRPLGGRDDHADLIHALIRKLIVQQARDIPMELERTADSLHFKSYGISLVDWDEDRHGLELWQSRNRTLDADQLVRAKYPRNSGVELSVRECPYFERLDWELQMPVSV